MSGRFASLHSGLLLRERPRAAQPCMAPVSPPTAVVRPFPTPAADPAPSPAAPAAAASRPSPRRRAFTLRFDESHYALLQIAKLRFGLSGQRLLLVALEKLMGAGGR
jgi:hypothetical protein